MLLEHELTIVDEKSLLIVVNNDSTMVVEREQWLLTTVVDRVQHNIVRQCAAQHCNKLLTTLIKLFIFARVLMSNEIRTLFDVNLPCHMVRRHTIFLLRANPVVFSISGSVFYLILLLP